MTMKKYKLLARDYQFNVDGLVNCLKDLYCKWQEYEDNIGVRADRFRSIKFKFKTR